MENGQSQEERRQYSPDFLLAFAGAVPSVPKARLDVAGASLPPPSPSKAPRTPPVALANRGLHVASPSRSAFQAQHIQTLTGHENAILFFASTRNELISCSQDHTIKIWDLEYFTCKGTLQGHTGSIMAIAVKDHYLFSAASENKIMIWDLNTQQCLAVLSGHTGAVFALVAAGDKLFCGCQDTFVKYVDLEPIFMKLASGSVRLPLQLDSALQTLSGHHGFVYTLAVTPRYLFSGSGDGSIKVWDRVSLQNVKTLYGHKGGVQSLAVDDAHLFSGSSDGSVKIWDLDSLLLTRILTLTEHETPEEVLAVASNSQFLFTGSSNGLIQIWEKGSWQLKKAVRKSEVVLALFANERLLFSGDNKGEIKVFSMFSSVRSDDDSDVSSDELASIQQFHSAYNETDELVAMLARFVAFPSVSSDPTKRKDCWDAAKWLLSHVEKFGLEAHLLEGAEGRNPLVFGRVGSDPSKPTVFIYSHYDVVPASDASSWISPPFTLTGKDGYLYGRGATDDKGPIVAILFALRELLAQGTLPINVRFLSEGEEETDSSGLKEALTRNAEFFSGSDVFLISNTNWIGEEQPCLMYGLRGVIHFKIRVSAGKKNLHSGVNGGGVSEPLTALVTLLSTLVDVDGRVLIPHFYDDVRPLSKAEEEMYARIDLDLGKYKEKFGVSSLRTETKEELLMKQWRYPTLSIHGVASSSNNNPTSIPCTVEGLISLRFVPDQRAEQLIKIVTDHLHREFAKFSERAPGIRLEVETTKVGDWWLAEHDSVYFKAAEAAISDVWGTQPLYIREGGTIPLTSYMEKVLNAPALLLPIGQASDSAHLHNERIRLENLKKGKDVFKKFFLNLGEKKFSGPGLSPKR